MQNIMDKLYENVHKKGHVCLGLDTDIEYIPQDFIKNYNNTQDLIFNFNKAIIDATLDVVSVYKVQIAYYEALGLKGLEAYSRTLKYLKEKKQIVIADVKRGDIAKTADMYAKAHFTGDFAADIITINPFMGMDTLEPYFPYLSEHGIFVLTATSNKGADDIEGIIAKDNRTVSQIVGEKLQQIGEQFMGKNNYSSIGAVVGCTNKNQTKAIRSRLKNMFFLIPGYGAQGGKAEDMADYLKDGNGGVVNSSRGILLAYKKDEYKNLSFEKAARAECINMRDKILKSL